MQQLPLVFPASSFCILQLHGQKLEAKAAMSKHLNMYDIVRYELIDTTTTLEQKH